MTTSSLSPEQLSAYAALGMFEVSHVVETMPGAPLEDKIAIYEAWIEANQDDPLLVPAWFNYGSAMLGGGDGERARACFEKAISINEDFIPAYVNLGYAWERLKSPTKADETWEAAANRLDMISPLNVGYKRMLLKQMARLREERVDLTGAEDALRKSLEIDPAQRDVVQHWAVSRQRQCKWPAVESVASLSVEKVIQSLAPVSLAAYSDDALLQLANARAYGQMDVGWPRKLHTSGAWMPPEQPRTKPLRVGYLSSDYRHHAIGFLMVQIFELHDRSNVEVFVYYCGPVSPDFVQERVKNTADHWADINGMSDEQAAVRIIGDEIDILVDINGYTNFARTSLLFLKPAPIIVNWLGYPGTMGTPAHNYIIADDYIVPKEYELFYSERVARLLCYQPNDRKRGIPPQMMSRTAAGLPENGVVFCCFNGLQKITSIIFRHWMTILHHVPGSVLWLLVDRNEDREHFQSLATQIGIASERLVFARWAANAEHLARYHLADLVLDTWPYGAHTTASDALWMGVPVVTWSGRSFASRVCGSLTRAAGVPELVCDTQEDYVNRAITLGRDRKALQQYREFLCACRETSTLFDTPRLVQVLEELYQGMWNDYESGHLPIPDLINLDVYHEVGAELFKSAVELLPDDRYLEAWRNGLEYRHAFTPMPADSRLRQPRE